MRLSAPQRHLAEVVAIKKRRLDDDMRAALLTIREEIEQRTASARTEYEAAVLDAHRAGVPKAAIARSVGTTNPAPIRAIIARAADRSRAATSDRYQRAGADELRVRLDGPALLNACEATGWAVVEALAAGVDFARFRVAAGPTLVALTPSYVADAGRLHPVVAAIRRDHAEALVWWEEGK